MAGIVKKPTKAAREAKATVVSDDVFAGRSFSQLSSDVQQLPEGDNRCRVTKSAKFYIVQLMGSWVHVSESAERSIRYRNGLKWVTFEKREYQLRKSIELKRLVGRFIQGGCYAHVGGKTVYSVKELNQLVDQEFIYLSSSAALKIFNELQAKTLRGR